MFASRFFAFIVAALVVTATPLPEKRAPLATVYTSCKGSKNVALTFDDGPYIYHQSIVDQLVAAGAKGTFFFNGNNWGCIYDPDNVARVKYAYNHGMMVGDHTWSHGDLTTFTTAQINDGMYRMEEAFSRLIGIKPAFMRPPYGNYNNNVLQIAYARNQSVAMWDQDSEDADGATVAFSEAVYASAVSANVPNMLFLNHETVETTSTTVLPYAIQLLQSHGYNLVTLAECLGVQPYAAIGIPQTGSWTCDGTPDPGNGCAGSIACETGTPILLTGTSTTTTTTSSSTTATTTSTTKGTTTTTTKGTTTTTTTSTTAAATGKTIRPGSSNSICLTAASNTDGAAVEIEPCTTGNAAQSWTVVGGTIQIYGNKCLDDTNGVTSNGNLLQIWTCGTGNPNQKFATSGSTIVWTGHNECVDLTNGLKTSGTRTQLWQCSAGNQNQVWNFV